MDIEINYEFGLRILISLLVGSAIGFEREYSSKAAGLRTMIMICMGSTILTLVSLMLEENSKDRVASSIVTGVGFLGAGVIFKDGLTVKASPRPQRYGYRQRWVWPSAQGNTSSRSPVR